MERSGTPCAHLKELENKFGMKTPESLLKCWSSLDLRQSRDHGTSDNLTDKIRNLKREMGCLRASDVQILRQLVALHEGMEAVRWLLLEEQGTLASSKSSLTGSQCSLIEVPATGQSLGMSGLQSLFDNRNAKPEQEQKVIFDMLTNTDSSKNARSGLPVEGGVVPTERPQSVKPHCLPLDSCDKDIVEVKEQNMLGYDSQWCWVESQDDVTYL